jgi:hypothetical protein
MSPASPSPITWEFFSPDVDVIGFAHQSTSHERSGDRLRQCNTEDASRRGEASPYYSGLRDARPVQSAFRNGLVNDARAAIGCG